MSMNVDSLYVSLGRDGTPEDSPHLPPQRARTSKLKPWSIWRRWQLLHDLEGYKQIHVPSSVSSGLGRSWVG